MRTIGHWIDGRPAGAPGAESRAGAVWNPATGEQRAEVLLASADEVRAAVRGAAEAFQEWSQTSLSKRSKVFFAFRELVNAHAEELAGLITD
ncbi:MAG: aldehyde dehydrogenase family protein, partial [Kineosporiaceae bacterium]